MNAKENIVDERRGGEKRRGKKKTCLHEQDTSNVTKTICSQKP